MDDLPWRLAYSERNDQVIISTVEVPFLPLWGEFETAISVDNQSWKIYKAYSTAEDALDGHTYFSKLSKDEIIKLEPLD